MSLYWILVLTLLHCLTANCRPYDDVFRVIKELQKENCSEPNSTFYSPSGNNECIIQALNCSMKELEPIKTECFEITSSGYRYVSRLRDHIKPMLTQTITLQDGPTNCFCEGSLSTSLSYHDFLKNIKTLIQKLNSAQKG